MSTVILIALAVCIVGGATYMVCKGRTKYKRQKFEEKESKEELDFKTLEEQCYREYCKEFGIECSEPESEPEPEAKPTTYPLPSSPFIAMGMAPIGNPIANYGFAVNLSTVQATNALASQMQANATTIEALMGEPTQNNAVAEALKLTR